MTLFASHRKPVCYGSQGRRPLLTTDDEGTSQEGVCPKVSQQHCPFGPHLSNLTYRVLQNRKTGYGGEQPSPNDGTSTESQQEDQWLPPGTQCDGTQSLSVLMDSKDTLPQLLSRTLTVAIGTPSSGVPKPLDPQVYQTRLDFVDSVAYDGLMQHIISIADTTNFQLKPCATSNLSRLLHHHVLNTTSTTDMTVWHQSPANSGRSCHDR